jgi:hypothetical protein
MISHADRKNPNEFWEMNYDEFNKWRKENDFPRILKFFQDNLKDFLAWQKEFLITNDDLIDKGIADFLSTGFILPTKKRSFPLYLITHKYPDSKEYKWFSLEAKKEGETIRGVKGEVITITSSKEFIPYLNWARQNKITIHPRAINNNVTITTMQAFDVPEYCSVFILDDLELLKLGGIKTKFTGQIGERLLQFVNLDFLNFEGKYWDSYGKNISYASARHWKIQNCELLSFQFRDTKLDSFQVDNSNLYKWEFIRCQGQDGKISKSKLVGCTFGEGSFIPMFDEVDLSDSKVTDDYLQTSEYGYSPSAELLRRMKIAFSSHGQHSIAGKYFYFERKTERKNQFKQSVHYLHKFISQSDLHKRILSIWKKRKESNMTVKMFIVVAWYLLKESPKTKNRFTFLKYYLDEFLKWLSSFIQEIWWGYGEKPIRVLIACFVVIILSCIVIYNLYSVGQGKTIYDSLWYSVVSFITLGDADFKPTGWIRLIVGFEGIMGILGFGFLISGFSGKSRY